MNTLFASYATGSAFRIDLSRRMVSTLLAAANGKECDTGHYGTLGLINRGLMEVIEGQKPIYNPKLRLTEAGKAVAALCVMAGLEVA